MVKGIKERIYHKKEKDLQEISRGRGRERGRGRTAKEKDHNYIGRMYSLNAIFVI